MNRVRTPAKSITLFQLLVWCLSSHALCQEVKLSELIKNSVASVVLIRVSDSAGKELALGSGFIVSSDGKIVTNYHVIKGAKAAVVELDNGASFVVEGILSSDEKLDLAVIKVKGKNLPSLALGDSDNVQVGEHVVAIGSPLGLEASVSDGIVSGVRSEDWGKWIQTTAPVSHGNSGGPLIATNGGNVLGIVTMGIDPSKAQNLNFAIPINLVKPYLVANVTPAPLGSIAPIPMSSSTGMDNAGNVWTSMLSGKDYKLRFDGDYLYTEWVNLPAELQGTMAFMRAELKKNGANWSGETRAYLPCKYWDGWYQVWRVQWYTVETKLELTSVTEKRIEGRAQNYPGGVDCKKGKPKGDPDWKSFTWIPK